MLTEDELVDDEIKVLSKSLPYLVTKGRANSTVQKYKAGWLGWLEWAKYKTEVVTRPAHPFYVAIYLNHLFLVKKNKGCITTAMYGIRWAHHVVGLVSPTDNPLVQMAHEGCMRLCGGEKVRKEAMPVEIIKKFVDEFTSSDQNLLNQRFIVLSLIGFAGFLRIEELLEVRIKDVTIFSDHIEIFLPKSKRDQHRQGNTVYIAKTGSKYCPVVHLEDFLRKAGLNVKNDKEAFIIPVLYKTKKGHKASKTRGVSYTRIREIFQEKIQNLNLLGQNYGLHSLRSGGASAAANNGVSDRKIAKQGRWSSETARNGYIKDDKVSRLEVTKA